MLAVTRKGEECCGKHTWWENIVSDMRISAQVLRLISCLSVSSRYVSLLGGMVGVDIHLGMALWKETILHHGDSPF